MINEINNINPYCIKNSKRILVLNSEKSNSLRGALNNHKKLFKSMISPNS